MLVYSKKRKILELIANAEFPFWQLVARGDLPEQLVVNPAADECLPAVRFMINQIQDNKRSQVKFIVGDVGSGKTLLFWRLFKEFEPDAYFVFVPVPMVKEKLILHVYSQLVEALGITRVREFISNLSAHWGGHQKIYGIFRSTNQDRVIRNGVLEEKKHTVVFDEEILEECVSVIVMADMDPEKKYLAERWILGELMDITEMDLLRVPRDLRDDETGLVMLQLLLNHLHMIDGPDLAVFFFDELEKAPAPIQIEEDEEDSNRPIEQETVQNLTSIFQVIGILQKYTRNSIHLATCSTGDWDRVRGTIPPKMHYLVNQEPFSLPPFSQADFLELVRQKLSAFWTREGIRLEALVPEDLKRPDTLPYFPFTQPQLVTIHELTRGSPREALRLLKKVLYQIVYDAEFDFATLAGNIRQFLTS